MVATKRVELKNAVALVFSIHRWGNRKAADKEKVETQADKDMLNLTKRLIEHSGEIKEVEMYMKYEVKQWVMKNSVPAFFQDGVYLVNVNQVAEMEAGLREASKELSKRLNKFLAVYPKRIDEAEKKLKPGQQFNRSDYPSVEELRSRYRFSWRWVEFGIPKELPEDVAKAEKKRVEDMWAVAGEQITQALRQGFKKLVDHAVNMLKVGPDGKTKAFKDATFENITEFIDSFKNRNLTDDAELAALVAKARKLLVGIDDPQELKKDADARKAIEKSFTAINKQLDKLIEIKPRRKFSFDD